MTSLAPESPFVIACVSRRGAGVWTQTPSLTYALLEAAAGAATAIWVDFGRRYEMFNHLRVDARKFPKECSLPGLIERRAKGVRLTTADLISYDKLVVSANAMPPLAQIQGEIAPYRAKIEALAAAGKKVYLMPAELADAVPAAWKTGQEIAAISETLREIYNLIRPDVVFLTWEGQPELSLFEAILSNDPLLRWGLSTCDMIMCHVRFDSPERFADGGPVAHRLATDPEYKDKVRVVLTRASREPSTAAASPDLVIGQVPFDAFVSYSVQNGRIPIVDTWIAHLPNGAGDGGQKFSASMNATAKIILNASAARRQIAVDSSRGNGGVCPFCDLPGERLVQEFDHFNLIVPLTPLQPGHILLVSKVHAAAIVTLPAQAILELKEILNQHLKPMEDGMTTVAWEHGNHGLGKHDEPWHSHAHVHVVPRVPGIGESLRRLGWPITHDQYGERTQTEREYFYYAESGATPMFLFPTSSTVPQFIRRMIRSAIDERLPGVRP